MQSTCLSLAQLALAVILPSLVSANQIVRYEQGQAWDSGKKTVMYTESHWSAYEGNVLKDRTVVYRCADGTPFARKEISYSQSKLAPAFNFRDERFNYEEGLRWRDGKAQLWHSLNNRTEQKALDVSADLVADAGFDVFVKDRWQSLAQTGSQPLQFAVPSRLTSYSFNLKRTGSMPYRNTNAQNFALELGGWLSFIAPSIELTYSNSSQRLLRFKGMSNILNNAGEKPVQALIEFPLNDQIVPEKEKRQAQAILLKSCQIS